VHGWLRWILTASLPIDVVSQQVFIEYTNLGTVSKKTLMKHMASLTKILEKKISNLLPDKFVLIFDGWSLDGTGTHFVGVFAKWMSLTGTVSTALLAFSPLLDESDFSAASHFEFIQFVLEEVYQKTLSNVICLVGDNCSTNKALADLCGKPLVGCAAHRFNLAVQKYLSGHDVLLTKVNELMTKLRTLKNAAKLRMLSPLRPRLRCATRWTGTFAMIERFFELKPHLDKMAEVDDVLSDHMVTMSELKALGVLRDKLEALSSVMTKLQEPKLTLAQVRSLFDGTLEKFPDLKSFLDADANIVHSPHFESGVVKLLRKQNSRLTEDEIKIMQCLEIDSKLPVAENDAPKSFADTILDRDEHAVEYMDVSFIPCGSVEVESLFSVCSHVWNDRRLGTTPEHMESYMFLKTNLSLWDAQSVAEAINATKGNQIVSSEKNTNCYIIFDK